MEYALIKTVAACFVSALVFGLIARKLKLPAIVGYLIAGIAIGPYTPGFFADVAIAKQLAEVGIILLMFGVGLHFSLKDLIKVRSIAIPGALFQILIATLIGATLIHWVGYSWLNGIVFGFSLSVASTVVLLRALEHRRLLNSEAGKISVGWLIVEDIAMIFAIVLLPVIGEMLRQENGIDFKAISINILEVTAKLSLFAVVMISIGRRVLPFVLVYVAKAKSQELMSLAVLSIAIGCSYAAHAIFDASYALGAFAAGLFLNASDIGNKTAEQSVPMRDVFAVLFFVSVGMLFDPMTLVNQPGLVLITLAIIIVGKGVAALFIMRFFKQSGPSSLVIAASLAQIGEFSFIFAALAVTEGLLPETLLNLILAGALLSIALNHFLFKAVDRWVLNRKTAFALFFTR